MNIHNKQIFQKDYFTSHYFSTTGNFGISELKRNKNWFYGWFRSLQDDFDFLQGNRRKALEIGCAIGAASAILAERGFDVTATDISPYVIKKVQKLLPHLKSKELDIEDIVSIKNTYDLIFAFEVIEHLENPKKAIENMYKMLKPGGTVILSTPYPYQFALYSDKTHINIRYPFEWVYVLREIGFSRIQYRHKTFIPFFYRLSKYFHIIFPFGVGNPYLNTPVFIIGQKS